MRSASPAEGKRAFFRQMLSRVRICADYHKTAPYRCGRHHSFVVQGRPLVDRIAGWRDRRGGLSSGARLGPRDMVNCARQVEKGECNAEVDP